MINPVGVEAARTPLDPIPDSPSPAAAPGNYRLDL